MAVTQTGPLTKNTANLALGLAQIRVAPFTASSGATAAEYGYFGTTAWGIPNPAGNPYSLGALASTKLTIERQYFTHEAGFPLLQDTQIPIRENASLECAFEEINGFTMALAAGKDPWTDGSGSVNIGAMSTPAFLRMEAHYTYPNNTDKMFVIFPRAQVLSNTEIDLQKEEVAKVSVTFKATRSDSGISACAGSAAWDSMPLGRIYWGT